MAWNDNVVYDNFVLENKFKDDLPYTLLISLLLITFSSLLNNINLLLLLNIFF